MKKLALLMALCLPHLSAADDSYAIDGDSYDQPSYYRQQGIASWYGPGFTGRRTASGARFNPSLKTIAHRTLKLGTMVLITNLRNHKSVVAQVTDRGPFHRGRIADLSPSAASAIGMQGSGTAPVLIVALS